MGLFHCRDRFFLRKLFFVSNPPSIPIPLYPALTTAAKPEDKGIIGKLGLDDWKFALPVGLFIGIPTMANEVLVLSAESQLVACFILFCSTMYTQTGGMIAKSLDEYRDNVYTQLKKVDDAMLIDIQASISANQKVLGMESDIKSVHTLMDDMAVAQAQALNAAEEHKYRDAVVKKLDSLVALEEAAVASLRSRMLKKVKSDVIKTFADDAKTKEKALEAAMAVLKSGTGAKLGKDVVGEVYLTSLQSYKAAYAKQPAGSDEIIVQLEKDIAAASSAPDFGDLKGGNVYETHPLISAKAK